MQRGQTIVTGTSAGSGPSSGSRGSWVSTGTICAPQLGQWLDIGSSGIVPGTPFARQSRVFAGQTRLSGGDAAAYACASSASVSRATSASSCTSADEEISSSEPSSALAARPALLSISSAIFVSMVCEAMIRHAVTGWS